MILCKDKQKIAFMYFPKLTRLPVEKKYLEL